MEELKSRRAQIKNEVATIDTSKIESDLQKEELRKQQKQQKKAELKCSGSYRLVEGIATAMDKYFLDPILGLLPGVGDALSSLLVMPYLYVSLFKVRSISLTLAILHNTLLDMCIGCIPWVGNIADFFYRGYLKSYQLIVGFVEDDKEVISEVNRKAFGMFILICVLGVILYYLLKLLGEIWNWIVGMI